jgi:hypothetical protein
MALQDAVDEIQRCRAALASGGIIGRIAGIILFAFGGLGGQPGPLCGLSSPITISTLLTSTFNVEMRHIPSEVL